MIKASELRIGNWVSNGEIPTKIDGLNKSAYLDPDGVWYYFGSIYPIPINETWLIRIGFNKESKPSSALEAFRVYTKDIIVYNTSHGHFWLNKSYGWFDEPVYVHQLQNLYYALTGDELISIK